MSTKFEIAVEAIRWATPIIAGLVGYYVRNQRTHIKNLEEKIEENEKKLVTVFREGLKEEREFRVEVMNKHDRHIEEIFGKLKDICVDGERLKTEIENCIKITDRIKFK